MQNWFSVRFYWLIHLAVSSTALKKAFIFQTRTKSGEAASCHDITSCSSKLASLRTSWYPLCICGSQVHSHQKIDWSRPTSTNDHPKRRLRSQSVHDSPCAEYFHAHDHRNGEGIKKKDKQKTKLEDMIYSKTRKGLAFLNSSKFRKYYETLKWHLLNPKLQEQCNLTGFSASKCGQHYIHICQFKLETVQVLCQMSRSRSKSGNGSWGGRSSSRGAGAEGRGATPRKAKSPGKAMYSYELTWKTGKRRGDSLGEWAANIPRQCMLLPSVMAQRWDDSAAVLDPGKQFSFVVLGIPEMLLQSVGVCCALTTFVWLSTFKCEKQGETATLPNPYRPYCLIGLKVRLIDVSDQVFHLGDTDDLSHGIAVDFFHANMALFGLGKTHRIKVLTWRVVKGPSRRDLKVFFHLLNCRHLQIFLHSLLSIHPGLSTTNRIEKHYSLWIGTTQVNDLQNQVKWCNFPPLHGLQASQ